MKIFLLLLMLSPLSIITYGQLTKNTWLIGGAGSSYTYTETFNGPSAYYTAKYTSVDISASVGYFFFDKFSGGLRPTISTYKGESSAGGSQNNLKFAIGPFLRYYFLNTEKKFNLLTDVSYQFGVNKNYGTFGDKGKYNIFSLMAGTEVFFNSSVGMEILVGYSNKLITVDDGSTPRRSNKTGLQTSIGFQFHLAK
ncbi:MAG: hypothetical protein I8H66_01845 [Sphingobacteriia bacterium]|nr:hypothetical protein [Sphingobacteriia bacterium]